MTRMAMAVVAILGTAVWSTAIAQQPDSGPASTGTGHPLQGTETGVRGPSNSGPDTGPHGQRDVTKNAEPGKSQPPEEKRKTGQTDPNEPPKK